jgi:hypothetical protein
VGAAKVRMEVNRAVGIVSFIVGRCVNELECDHLVEVRINIGR